MSELRIRRVENGWLLSDARRVEQVATTVQGLLGLIESWAVAKPAPASSEPQAGAAFPSGSHGTSPVLEHRLKSVLYERSAWVSADDPQIAQLRREYGAAVFDDAVVSLTRQGVICRRTIMLAHRAVEYLHRKKPVPATAAGEDTQGG